MINLLQGSEKRQLQLAELLIHNGDWMKLESLAQTLNCSERTLKHDFKNFKQTFYDFEIETSYRGVRLMFDDNKGLKNIYSNLFDRSNTFKMLEIIFFDETHNINELAEILYISPSTLYRVIHQINEVVKDYGFQIDTNPCKALGDEGKIRFFYYQYFYEKYTIMTWPYDHINQDMLNDLLYFFIDLMEFKADFAYYNIAKLMLFVNLNRYQKEHYVVIDRAKIDLADIFSKLELTPENTTYFEKRYKLKIDDSLVIQLFSPFVKEGFLFNYNQLESKSKKNKSIDAEIDFLRNLLEKLSQTNHIALTNKEKVVFELHNASYIANYDPRAGFILYNRNKFFVDTIKSYYPVFSKQLQDGLKEYRRTAGRSVTEKDINYLTYILFTEWENLLLELFKKSQKIKVLIISNRNKAHSYMLKDYLKLSFSNSIIAEIYDDTLVTKNILEELPYDFIITNFPIPPLKTKDSIYIENFPTENETYQIHQKITEILSRN